MLGRLLRFATDRLGLSEAVIEIVRRWGATDLLGELVNLYLPVFRQRGRSAVVAAVTIRSSSLRRWADKRGADPDAVVAAWGGVAIAFADFVEILWGPRPRR